MFAYTHILEENNLINQAWSFTCFKVVSWAIGKVLVSLNVGHAIKSNEIFAGTI